MFIALVMKGRPSSVRSDMSGRGCRPAGAWEILCPRGYKHRAPPGLGNRLNHKIR
jgi:hypothetical protein